jgi:hypothetical protein
MWNYPMNFREWLDKSGYFMSEPSAVHEKLFEAWQAAQHKMHQTAFGVGGLCFAVGVVVGCLL